MSIQVLCISNGVPYWISSYPDLQIDTGVLIGGFLGAINLFAKEISGNFISNMTIGNEYWMFTNINGINELFIVSRVELTGDFDEIAFKKQLSQQLIHEIVEDFQIQYPKEFLTKALQNRKTFDGFKIQVDKKLQNYISAMNRYKKHDINWLVKFTNADQLITGLLSQALIFIVEDNPDSILNSDNLMLFLGTVESILGYPIKNIINIEDNSQTLMNTEGHIENIYLIRTEHISMIYAQNKGVFVNITEKKIIYGPVPSSLSQQILSFILNHPKANYRDLSYIVSQINPNITDNNSVEHLFHSKTYTQTEFSCLICKKKIFFNIHDNNSYITKLNHQTFFGMELTTYKVAHFNNNEIHANSVLVDDQGIFHGSIEAFVQKINEKVEKSKMTFQNMIILTNEQVPLQKHKIILQLLIINIEKYWLLEIVVTPLLNSLEIGKIIVQRIHENAQVYTQLPQFSKILIADKTYSCWHHNSIIIAASLKDENSLDIINPVLDEIGSQKYRDQEWLSKRERMNIMLNFIENNSFKKYQIPFISRVFFDNLLYSTIKIKYPHLIPQIIARISKEFERTAPLLQKIIMGEVPIIEIIKKNYEIGPELIELIDFINRRKLI